MTNLVLQILGNSDILSSDNHEGYTILEEFGDLGSKDEILKKVKELPLDEIDFPLIKKLIDSEHDEFDLKNDTIFCFILSDQSIWINENEPYKEFIYLAKKDGIYWKDSLKSWFKAHYQNLDCFTIPIVVDSTIKNGVADWESMTKLIQKCLNDRIDFSGEEIKFKPPCENEGSNQPGLTINKIIIQHSSGTPALSGALYLWGIEHKIEGRDVEFVYISDQHEDKDSCEFHSGSHWQWRLKVPQIQELLKIQDFSGAIQLVKSHKEQISSEAQEYKRLKCILNSLKELDKAVSFNLSDHPVSTPKDAVIERIAIALWSETAFRERGQWMHWYLRVTGAFELAILCLLKKQGNSQFEWKKETINSQNLKKSEELQKSISLFANNHNFSKSPLTTDIVKNLTLGKINNKHSHPIEPIDANNQKWNDFKLFYLTNGNFLKFLDEKDNLGFTDIRNKMYHNLMGDIIDDILDKVTQERPINHPQHPSQVAINHLEYIIEISGLENEINNKVNKYKQKFESLKECLKCT
jgi:hypothetical protein